MSETSGLKQRLDGDIKSALKQKEKSRLGVLRLVTAAIKQREVDERVQLGDEQVLAVLDKMVKQRRDSVEQYRKAGREDLAVKEEYEIGIIQEYLPAALTDDELDALVTAAIAESGATSAREMGKVIGLLKPKVQGRADMGAVSARVKAKLPTP